jgi:hypothetical protein
MMENHIVTGIGCFAQPQKLSQVFLRVMKSYTLGQVGATDLVEGCHGGESANSQLIRALIDGEVAGREATTGEIEKLRGNQKITGFYLTLKGGSLKLSIFARDRACRQEIFCANLHELTRIRQKRLH